MRQEDFNRRVLWLLFFGVFATFVYYWLKSQLRGRRREDMPWYLAALAIALRWSPGRTTDSRLSGVLEHLNGDSVESLGRQDRGRCRPGRSAATPSGGTRSARGTGGRGRRTVEAHLPEPQDAGSKPGHRSGHSPSNSGLPTSPTFADSGTSAAPVKAGDLDFLEGLSSSSEQSDLDTASVASGGGNARAQPDETTGPSAASSSQARVLHDLRIGSLPTSEGDGQALGTLSEELLGLSVWEVISKKNRLRVTGLLHTRGEGACEALGFTVHRLNQHTLQILYLGVAESSRRGGIGRSLVRAVREVARREPMCLSIVVLLSEYREGSPLMDMASPSLTAFLRATGFRRMESKAVEESGKVCFKIEVRKLGKKQKRQMDQSGARFSGSGTTLDWNEVLYEAKRAAAANRSAKAVATLRLPPPPVQAEKPAAGEHDSSARLPPAVQTQVHSADEHGTESIESEIQETTVADSRQREEENDIGELEPALSDLGDSSRLQVELAPMSLSQDEHHLQACARLPTSMDLEEEWEIDQHTGAREEGGREVSPPEVDQPVHGTGKKKKAKAKQPGKVEGTGLRVKSSRWAPGLPQQASTPESVLQEVPREIPEVAPSPVVLEEVTSADVPSIAPESRLHSSEALSADLLEPLQEENRAAAVTMMPSSSVGGADSSRKASMTFRPQHRDKVTPKRLGGAAGTSWRPTLRHMQPAETSGPQGR